METTTTVVISAVVLAAVEIAKQFGCQRGAGLVISLLLSLLIVALYAVSHETHYEPIMLWNYTTGWIVVSGTATGVHSAVKNTAQIVQDKADARRAAEGEIDR